MAGSDRLVVLRQNQPSSRSILHYVSGGVFDGASVTEVERRMQQRRDLLAVSFPHPREPLCASSASSRAGREMAERKDGVKRHRPSFLLTPHHVVDLNAYRRALYVEEAEG